MAANSFRLTRRGRFVAVLLLLSLCLASTVLLAPQDTSPTPSFDDPIGALDYSKVPDGLGPQVDAAARVADIPAPVLAAQLEVESKWDQHAQSQVGAQGLAQFTPDSWAMYGRGGDPFNPRDAIAAQGRLMRYLKQRADHSGIARNHVELALAGYNAGFENVVKYRGVPPFKETKNYVDAVARRMDHYALPLRKASSQP